MPESTVRYYRDRFPEFIPSTGEGRNKRYKREAIDVLRFIAENLRNNLTAEQVTELLMQKFTRFIDISLEPQPTTAAAQQQELQPTTTAILKAFEESTKIISQQTATIAQLQEEKNRLEEKNERLFNEFMELNKKHTELLNKNKKGFFSRLFGS